jgi:diguanylate cyclase (GGDEF)-like protein
VISGLTQPLQGWGVRRVGRGRRVAVASRAVFWFFALGYLCLSLLHVLAVALDTNSRLITSDIVVGLMQWLTLAALAWRLRHSSVSSRYRWSLLLAGIAFVHIANDIDLYLALGGKYNQVPGLPLFCDAIYAALIVLSGAATSRRRTMRLTNLIDAAMAVALVALFYFRIFSLVSVVGSDDPGHVIFVVRMVDVMGVFIALCIGVRLLGAQNLQRRHYFFVTFLFLCTSAAFAAVRNRLVVAGTGGYPELLLLPQLVVLGLLSLRTLPARLQRYQPRLEMVHFTESLSPLFLGLGLLAVSISLWPTYPTLGAVGVCVAVTGYGVRNIVTQSELMATEHKLLAFQEVLQNLVITDQLTGITNRRGLDIQLERLWNQVAGAEESLTILMIDVDRFKLINDTYGHAFGDICLSALASCLHRVLTPLGGVVARYGGEEFAVLLPGTTLDRGVEIGNQIRLVVEGMPVPNGNQAFFMTVSVGVASSQSSHVSSGKALLAIADDALLDAKGAGRNQVRWRSVS